MATSREQIERMEVVQPWNIKKTTPGWWKDRSHPHRRKKLKISYNRWFRRKMKSIEEDEDVTFFKVGKKELSGWEY